MNAAVSDPTLEQLYAISLRQDHQAFSASCPREGFYDCNETEGKDRESSLCGGGGHLRDRRSRNFRVSRSTDSIPAFGKLGVFRFMFGDNWSPDRLDTYDSPLSEPTESRP